MKRQNEILEEYQVKADVMKRSVLNTPNLPDSAISGRRYYVSACGNDDFDGLTPEKAVKSLKRAESLPLQYGDAVLFRRGDMFRGSLKCVNGITYSAWGEGDKPVLCCSRKNFADSSLWYESDVPGIWCCTETFDNPGIITFNHDPRVVGKYDVQIGWLVPSFPENKPLEHLEHDLEFWSDFQTGILYLKSVSNPGSRFQRIEIGENIHSFCACQNDLLFDNLHITMTGAHGISAFSNKNMRVQNCIFDYIGGSVWSKPRLIRYGNAVEIYGGCSGYYVSNNWMYQIYDTGITHQCNDQKTLDVTQENVEYWNNLIEYCFWSIEYYNMRNKYGITQNIYVHDNFCRFGGLGWGCVLRKKSTPMYSFGVPAEETKNYRTENNIFQFSEGYILNHPHPLEPAGSLFFKGNTYIQWSDGMLAKWGNNVIPFEEGKASRFLKEVLGEENVKLITVSRS